MTSAGAPRAGGHGVAARWARLAARAGALPPGVAVLLGVLAWAAGQDTRARGTAKTAATGG